MSGYNSAPGIFSEGSTVWDNGYPSILISDINKCYSRIICCGLNNEKPPVKILLGMYAAGSGAEFDVLIRDITNCKTIASGSSISLPDSSFEIIELSSLSNLSEGFAVWEVQLQRTAGTVNVRYGGFKILSR